MADGGRPLVNSKRKRGERVITTQPEAEALDGDHVKNGREFLKIKESSRQPAPEKRAGPNGEPNE